MTGIIYALCDPDTGELRYVGQTIQNPQKRLSQHLTAAKRGRKRYRSDYPVTTLVGTWIRSLPRPPKMVVLERAVAVQPRDDPAIAPQTWRPTNIAVVEKEWIWALFRMGYQLLNSDLVHGPQESPEMMRHRSL